MGVPLLRETTNSGMAHRQSKIWSPRFVRASSLPPVSRRVASSGELLCKPMTKAPELLGKLT